MPLRLVVEEVEEIAWEPMNVAPQVFRTVVRHGYEFDMLEDVASTEMKVLRADLAMMMCHIEVS